MSVLYRVEILRRGKWRDAGLQIDAAGTEDDGKPETFPSVEAAEDAIEDFMADSLADGRPVPRRLLRVAPIQ